MHEFFSQFLPAPKRRADTFVQHAADLAAENTVLKNAIATLLEAIVYEGREITWDSPLAHAMLDGATAIGVDRSDFICVQARNVRIRHRQQRKH